MSMQALQSSDSLLRVTGQLQAEQWRIKVKTIAHICGEQTCSLAGARVIGRCANARGGCRGGVVAGGGSPRRGSTDGRSPCRRRRGPSPACGSSAPG